MSFKEIMELINMINKSQISFMELNYEKVYLKLDKSLNRCENSLNSNLNFDSQIKNDNKNYKMEIKESEDSLNISSIDKMDLIENDDNAQYIVSPMVGTVYLAPAPDKETYVSQNQEIKSGDVVCIVEAMKLMNEIESEYSGKISEILVKNGQMVEYGQKLFKIKKS